MQAGRILIVGGYGAFGSRVAERLAREVDLDIVIAGRSLARAEACVAALAARSKAKLGTAVVDALAVTAADLKAIGPAVVVNASGPFQAQDYTLARACIGAGCHYVDLADARVFVTGIAVLDGEAKAAGVAVVSGASTVPGLSSAVVREFEPRFETIKAIEIAISPGSGFEPGEAAAAAGLSYLGRPIRVPGRPARVVYGWQGLQRLHFPGLGRRWTGYCDVPDLDLFPQHYPSLERIEFRAGLEVGLFQIGLWLLSWPARIGLIAKPERMARVPDSGEKPIVFSRHQSRRHACRHRGHRSRWPAAIRGLVVGRGKGRWTLRADHGRRHSRQETGAGRVGVSRRRRMLSALHIGRVQGGNCRSADQVRAASAL